MNKDDYKSAMSCVRHSEDFTERIMNMATERTKRSMKTKGKRLAIAAACVVLLAAGLFGGNAISARRGAAGNGFSITAYAYDRQAVNLKDTPIVKTEVHLDYQAADGTHPAVSESSTGFQIDGKNIKSVTYSAEHGDFSCTAGNDTVVLFRHSDDPKTPYASTLELELQNDESVLVDYRPSEAVDLLLSAEPNTVSLGMMLVNDTIRITVEYKDGTTEQATIHTSFDNGGNLQLEYQE